MLGLLFICCAGPVQPATETVAVHEHATAFLLTNFLWGRDGELLHMGKPWDSSYVVHWPPLPNSRERRFAVEQFSIIVWTRRSAGVDGSFVDERTRHNFFATSLNAYFAKGRRINYWMNSVREYGSQPYYGTKASPVRAWFKGE